MSDLHQRPYVKGVLFFGSAQRGTASPSSDVDLYVLVNGRTRWHEGLRVEDVQVELSFAPAAYLRSLMEGGSPVVTHAFATGDVLLDRSGEASELVAMGRRLWREGPRPLTDDEVTAWRFRLTDLLTDLQDMPPDSPDERFLAGALVPLALDAYCALHRQWPVERKTIFTEVSRRDHRLSALLVQCYGNGIDPKTAVAIADQVLQPFGGRLEEYRTDPVTS